MLALLEAVRHAQSALSACTQVPLFILMLKLLFEHHILAGRHPCTSARPPYTLFLSRYLSFPYFSRVFSNLQFFLCVAPSSFIAFILHFHLSSFILHFSARITRITHFFAPRTKHFAPRILSFPSLFLGYPRSTHTLFRLYLQLHRIRSFPLRFSSSPLSDEAIC